MGAVHWLLYALGPVVTIISKKDERIWTGESPPG